jgi:hypothetical protein
MLNYVVDEGVQIHGGYGFHQDYAVERAYRDSRINRIFEGTNEINRLLIPGMLLKRAARGRLSLFDAPPAPVTGDTAEDRLVANAKKLALHCLDSARRKFGDGLDRQQEVLMQIADMVIEAYVMDSALLRARKLAGSGKETSAGLMTAILLRDATNRIEIAARNVAGATGETIPVPGYDPINAIDLRRQIAARLLQTERYVV